LSELALPHTTTSPASVRIFDSISSLDSSGWKRRFALGSHRTGRYHGLFPLTRPP